MFAHARCDIRQGMASAMRKKGLGRIQAFSPCGPQRLKPVGIPGIPTAPMNRGPDALAANLLMAPRATEPCLSAYSRDSACSLFFGWGARSPRCFWMSAMICLP